MEVDTTRFQINIYGLDLCGEKENDPPSESSP